jgi:hypothetical protein
MNYLIYNFEFAYVDCELMQFDLSLNLSLNKIKYYGYFINDFYFNMKCKMLKCKQIAINIENIDHI